MANKDNRHTFGDPNFTDLEHIRVHATSALKQVERLRECTQKLATAAKFAYEELEFVIGATEAVIDYQNSRENNAESSDSTSLSNTPASTSLEPSSPHKEKRPKSPISISSTGSKRTKLSEKSTQLEESIDVVSQAILSLETPEISTHTQVETKL